MPSQRLLKIADAFGHAPRVLDSAATKVLYYAGTPKTAAWIARELAGASAVVLRAVSFRHVTTSLRPGGRPVVDLAIVELDGLSEIELGNLAATRWMGYRGQIVGVSRAARTHANVASIIRPLDGALRDFVAGFRVEP